MKTARARRDHRLRRRPLLPLPALRACPSSLLCEGRDAEKELPACASAAVVQSSLAHGASVAEGSMRFMFVSWILIAWDSFGCGGAFEDDLHNFNVSDVLDGLLDTYDKRLRPGYDKKRPTKILVDLNIRSMGPISESDMTYSMDTYFRQTWRDERLKFSGPYDQLAVSTMILNEIWKPDTYFHNGQGAYLHTTTTPNKLLRIRNNGVVLYSMRLTIKASCPMYLQRFPVDMQSCPLQFGSYAYTSKHVVYEWKNGQHNSIETAGDMRLSQFDLVSTPAETVVVSNNSGEFSTLKVHFVLQRHMGYFLIQVYVPCTLIVILSWVSFWINREATSDRVSLGILTELTLTTISMDTRNDVPRVAYATALDHFFIMCYVFVTATLLEFAGVHYFTKIGSGEATFDADYCPPSEDSADDEGEDIPNNTNSMHYHSNSVYYRSHDNQCSLNGGAREAEVSPTKRDSSFYKLLKCLTGSYSYKKVMIERSNPQGVNRVSRIDRAARVLFPLSFIILNIIYWMTYTKYAQL